MADQKQKHVLVEVYGVPFQSFEKEGFEYWQAEVSQSGLYFGDNGDPSGTKFHAETEQEVKTLMRSELKSLYFSKKMIEFRRV